MSENTRRQRRRRNRIPTPLRWLGMVGAGMFCAWVLFELMVKIVHPYQLGDQQAKKAQQLRQQLAQQEARNTDLRKQVAYLRTEEGAEALARRAGYHRPKEEVYLLTPSSQP